MDQQGQSAWTKKELASIMEGNKTRYKVLVSDPAQLLEVENALLLVAKHKAQAYENATSGKVDDHQSASNWIAQNPELVKSIRILGYNFINVGDISMLPA